MQCICVLLIFGRIGTVWQLRSLNTRHTPTYRTPLCFHCHCFRMCHLVQRSTHLESWIYFSIKKLYCSGSFSMRVECWEACVSRHHHQQWVGGERQLGSGPLSPGCRSDRTAHQCISTYQDTRHLTNTHRVDCELVLVWDYDDVFTIPYLEKEEIIALEKCHRKYRRVAQNFLRYVRCSEPDCLSRTACGLLSGGCARNK